MHKLKANAVCFAIPQPKVYSVLPLSREDLDKVLAFIYLGPTKPTSEDFKRTPFLVRRNKVAAALDWLKLNYIDYADLKIFEDNINTYSEDTPPVKVNFQFSQINTNSESTAVHDSEDNEGTTKGQCSFVVHDLTGGKLDYLMKENPKKVRAIAIQHFKKDGKVLGIGHTKKPESLYNNPQLYPQMFPWLFSYRLGVIENKRCQRQCSLFDTEHKKILLMYHDK
ncbi:hypothetical protein K474DRAFT_1574222, partial [Panus rudis PR-1116 ss-1]